MTAPTGDFEVLQQLRDRRREAQVRYGEAFLMVGNGMPSKERIPPHFCNRIRAYLRARLSSDRFHQLQEKTHDATI